MKARAAQTRTFVAEDYDYPVAPRLLAWLNERRLDWEEIADLRQRGWLIKDIAAKVGATKSGVQYALMMHNAKVSSVARPKEDT